MKNGWTGGQYSLFRIVFGTCLLVHFARLVPRGVLTQEPLIQLFPSAYVTAFLVLAGLLSVLFAAGFHDRPVAILLGFLWACFSGLPFVTCMLLAHALLPPAPYGSWAARHRPDPAGGWRFPPLLFAAAWILMSLGYAYSGCMRLIYPTAGLLKGATWVATALELAFAPLALVRRARPWIWLAMLLMHFGLMVLIGFTDLSLSMVMLHFFTFDPAWIPAKKASATETLFYDGRCGLCHRAVRFILAEDRGGDAFRLAPLDSAAFRAAVPEDQRAKLPDSLVLRTDDGRILTKSSAVTHLLQRLGGVWHALGFVLRPIPASLRDFGYDFVAKVRHRLFAKPPDSCPLMPPSMRSRFDA